MTNKEKEQRDNVKYCAECNMTMKRIDAKRCSYCGKGDLVNLNLGEGS